MSTVGGSMYVSQINFIINTAYKYIKKNRYDFVYTIAHQHVVSHPEYYISVNPHRGKSHREYNPTLIHEDDLVTPQLLIWYLLLYPGDSEMNHGKSDPGIATMSEDSCKVINPAIDPSDWLPYQSLLYIPILVLFTKLGIFSLTESGVCIHNKSHKTLYIATRHICEKQRRLYDPDCIRRMCLQTSHKHMQTHVNCSHEKKREHIY